MYGLSYNQLMQEPIEKLLLNLKIESMIKDKERLQAKNG